MFKAYHIKWFFILPSVLVVLTSSSLLLRKGGVTISWLEIVNYSFHLFSLFFVCWITHAYFLIHNFKFLKNFAKPIVSLLVATLAASLLNYVLYLLLPKTVLMENTVGFDTIANVIVNIIGASLLSLVSFIVFYSVHTNSALQNSQLANESLEQAHLRAQLLSLQQQISPHFLFNSLSTLKTIANDQPTKNYIVQLAGVYRYLLNVNERYLAEVKDELTFINSYLYILTQRFEESLSVTIEIPDKHLKYLIPPLSLQLLIENAVKHNRISPEQPLHILIASDNSPAIKVENNFQPKNVPEEGTGTGLKNITERYKLLADKSIRIQNEAGKFSVTLPLLSK